MISVIFLGSSMLWWRLGSGEDEGAEQMPGGGRHLADAKAVEKAQADESCLLCFAADWKGPKKVPVRAGTRQEPAARGGCRLAKETSRRQGGHPGPLPFLSPQSLQACCFRVSPVRSLFPPGVDFIVEES